MLNPVEGIKKKNTDRREINTLPDAQVEELLTAARGKRLEALYHLAVTTGIRKGELLGVCSGNLDLAN